MNPATNDPFNRTGQFHAFATEYQKTVKPNPKTKVTYAQASEFAKEAGEIGVQIHLTTEKLKRLASSISKSASLFRESTVGSEISQKTAELNHDIHEINAKIKVLSQKQSNSENPDSVQHNKTVLKHLDVMLTQTSVEFRDLLQKRADNLEAQRDRKSRLLRTDDMKPSFIFTPPPEASESDSVLIQRNTQALVRAPSQDSYLVQRADAMQQVQQTLTQLQTMFRQVTDMVATQGEYVERIDMNTAEAEVNVHGAYDIISKELTRVSQNRGLILKSLGIVFVMFLVWIIFFL